MPRITSSTDWRITPSLTTRHRPWLKFGWQHFCAASESRGNFTVTNDGTSAPPSLQDAHKSSAFRVGRHCGTLHAYKGEAHEKCRFDLPEIRGALISLWLYKENNKLRDWKNVFTLHIPPWSPHTYDFVVPNSLTHPRKFFCLCCKPRIGKKAKPKTYQHPYVLWRRP
jgi:hypothetical protein